MSRRLTADNVREANAAAELECNFLDCPAAWVHEVEILEQDFRFCNHHQELIEPSLIEVIDTEGILVEA